MSVTVIKVGPLFDGRAEEAVQDACDDMEKTVATLGAAVIRATMDTTFRRQTPFYRLKNEAVPDAPGWKIWDQGVIYGHWLEGTGSCNRTTRFKGYRIYRTQAKILDQRAKVICESVMARYVGRMS